jgi:RecA-family ATPase
MSAPILIDGKIVGMPWPALDLSAAISQQPPPLDYVLPGLVAGTLGAAIAPGGTGKTNLASALVGLVGAGVDLLGLGPHPVGRGVLLAGEDPAQVLHQRVHAFASRLNDEQRDLFKENVIVLSCVGQTGDLLDGGATAAKIEQAAQGARVLFIDTLSRFFGGDENDRRDAARAMRALEGIAHRTGAAIVFLHHTSKSAALGGDGDQQQAARGSSVFVDESRWVAFLQTCTPTEAAKFGIAETRRRDFVRYGLSKANYIAPQLDIWLRREVGGVLVRYEYEMRERPKPRHTNRAQQVAAALGAEMIDDPDSL